MKYPAYPEYKDSGVEWLGEVPEHWIVKRLGYIALLKSGENITSEQIAAGGDYPVYGGNGLRGYYSAYTYDGTFVLIGRQGALCGNINYSTGKFWASEHAVIVNPLVPLITKWLGELLFAMNLNQYSISAAQPGLSVSMISALKIPVPPLPEQTAIADFLDQATGKIDNLVAKKRTLIGLLKEKRTALISRTVTRGLPAEVAPEFGLEPHTRFKDSGVEWLGDMPDGWGAERLRRTCQRVTDGAHISPDLSSDDFPFVSTVDITAGQINFDGCIRTSTECITILCILDVSPYTGMYYSAKMEL
ncbi:MAG: restriction endonuclease subunit S [Deltaproteobacteria bacterium]|nr:restriction endonuclease subunit S [Deltaproteobacteria bacterium]